MRKTFSPWHLTLKYYLSCLPERILVSADLFACGYSNYRHMYFFSNSIVNKDAGYDKETD